MVEAIAERGYNEASVKQVIGLAGVSRRSFYEQFQNKQDCFLATFDVIAGREIRRIRRTYSDTPGGLETRLQAVFGSIARIAEADRKAALLVLVDAQTAGPAGTLRLRRASAACEELLGLSFEHSSRASALPAPIVRAITGGLHGVLSTRLRSACEPAGDALADELLAWTLAFQTPDMGALAKELQTCLRRGMREIAQAHHDRAARPPAPEADERARLLHSMLKLATLHRYADISSPQIADGAGVPIEAFFEHFEDRDECFAAALETIGAELREIASDPALRSANWPSALRDVLERLMRHVAERPLYARAIIHNSCSAGSETFAWSGVLAHEIAAALLAGSPTPVSSARADAVAGALWHTIRCQVAGERIPLLAALADHLAYVVLSACLGATAASEVFREQLVSGGGGRAVPRST